MDDSTIHLGLKANAAARVAIGMTAIAAPNLAARALGGEPTSALRLAARIAGARDVAIGGGYLLAGANARRQWQLAALLADVVDAFSAGRELSRPDGDRSAMSGTVAVAGLSALQQAGSLALSARS